MTVEEPRGFLNEERQQAALNRLAARAFLTDTFFVGELRNDVRSERKLIGRKSIRFHHTDVCSGNAIPDVAVSDRIQAILIEIDEHEARDAEFLGDLAMRQRAPLRRSILPIEHLPGRKDRSVLHVQLDARRDVRRDVCDDRWMLDERRVVSVHDDRGGVAFKSLVLRGNIKFLAAFNLLSDCTHRTCDATSGANDAAEKRKRDHRTQRRRAAFP